MSSTPMVSWVFLLGIVIVIAGAVAIFLFWRGD
jgi:hypothetical protein